MGVIIFGREHDQPGVLIELKPGYTIDPSIEAEMIKGRNLVWYVRPRFSVHIGANPKEGPLSRKQTEWPLVSARCSRNLFSSPTLKSLSLEQEREPS